MPKKPPKMQTPKGKYLLPPTKITNAIYEEHKIKRGKQFKVFFLVFETIKHVLIDGEHVYVRNIGAFSVRKYNNPPSNRLCTPKFESRCKDPVYVPILKADPLLKKLSTFFISNPDQFGTLSNILQQRAQSMGRFLLPTPMITYICDLSELQPKLVCDLIDLLFRHILLRILQRKVLDIQGFGFFGVCKRHAHLEGNPLQGDDINQKSEFIIPRLHAAPSFIAETTEAYRARLEKNAV